MDARVTELHCIMPIANLPSVLQHGILSNERATQLPHHSVASQPVQQRRDQRQVPGGLKLHQYANLYFHARNPMMYSIQDAAPRLCVLRVSIDVLTLDGVAITDRNAASTYVRFCSPRQWKLLDFGDIFALDWTVSDDQIRGWQRKSRKCAEVLIPHVVEPRFITGIYVADSTAAASAGMVAPNLFSVLNPLLFFR